MNRFLLVLIILSASIATYAQQNHFIYLQTDNKQAFYVKMNDKLYSSSSSGHVVIPKLQNGNYNFTVGFPKNEWTQQTMAIKIDNNDLGFMLKNFGDKGWGLFNIQTLNVTMASSAAVNTNNTESQNKTDGFSNVLADVVNTPSLKKSDIEKVAAEPKLSLTAAATATVVKEINTVKIITTILDNEGRSAIYIDKTDNVNDTVNLFIPYEKIISVKEVRDEKRLEKKDAVNGDPKEDAKFLNIELPNPNTIKDSTKDQPSAATTAESIKTVPEKEVNTNAEKTTVLTNAVNETPLKQQSINSDCKNLATDNDFMKLRKKMASENKDDNMIGVAKKAFKSNCFSTEQIKNLSVLFLKDDGRYRFFDAAYPFVYDSQNFNTLQMQLTDEYLINRFKAMIRH